jgi:Poly(A) polymerase
MRTSEEIYHRVRWDPRFDPARFVLGVDQRGAAPKRVPLPGFTPGEIPWHRVLFIEADGVVVWDRATGVDRVDSLLAGRAGEPRLLRAPLFAARTPHAWDPAARAWRPAFATVRRAAARQAGPRLRVLTWNTLWDRYNSDRIDTARRRPLLLDALRDADADVIALQEVEAGLLEPLLRAGWVRERYVLGTDPAGPDVPGTGLLLLSRVPVREAGLLTLGPHKAVAAVTVETAAGPLVVAGTHLTSDHSADGAARRRAELAAVAEGLAGVDGDVVLLGDFNDGGTGPDGPAAALGLRDAWTEAHGPDDRTPTFDPVANPLAAISSLSGRAARLDRVLLRSPRLRVAEATLLGDRPVDGRYLSDHYGVLADLELGPAAPPDAMEEAEAGHVPTGVAAVPPTPRTALAWIPPRELWPAIQRIRREHDPRFDRWPPHVNLLFGFVPECDFERAAPLIAEAAAETAPFPARLAGAGVFAHGGQSTVWLDPAAGGAEPWAALYDALARRFPRCRRRGGFTPHLTLGRTADAARLVAHCADPLGAMSARVGELALLSRRGDEPMRVRARVTLGTGEIRWVPEPVADGRAAAVASGRGLGDDAAEREPVRPVVEAVSAALGDGAVVHVTGSRRMGCALPGADLDLVAVLPGSEVDLARVRQRVAEALPEADRLRPVVGARVPGLRFAVSGIGVDLALVPAGPLDPAEAVRRRAELGETAALALSAVSDAAAVLAAAGDARAAFARLARAVKAWARARGLDAAPFGGLPGLAWAVLAVLAVRDAGDLPAAELLRRFFATWAAWDWREPIALGRPPGEAPSAPVTVLTPSDPIRNCALQVGPGGRDLLTQELYEAWEILDAAERTGEDPWPALLAPPPLHRRHAAWALLSVRAARPAEFDEVMGRVRGRMRALLAAFAEAGATDAQAWPRPFDSGPAHARYAIGLGRTPPSRAVLTEAAEAWRRGLPDVRVDFAANGQVPTLR